MNMLKKFILAQVIIISLCGFSVSFAVGIGTTAPTSVSNPTTNTINDNNTPNANIDTQRGATTNEDMSNGSRLNNTSTGTNGVAATPGGSIGGAQGAK